MLSDEEWFRFGNGGISRVVHVCTLTPRLAATLGSHVRKVHINPHYAQKIRFKHRIRPEERRFIATTLELGLALHFAPNKLGFQYWDKQRNRYYEVVIKCTSHRDEFWVCTFHRQSKAEIKRKQKKYAIVHR